MDVFFYGLFMDESILLKKGILPSDPRIGYLKDYKLEIGNRASLIPCKNKRSYGIVMSCEKAAIHKLYDESSVADYLPEEVIITLNSQQEIKAICYILPEKLMSGTNKSYAFSLYNLAKEKGLPKEYLAKILSMS